MVARQVVDEVLASLAKPRLNAFQQAHILIEAMKAEILRKPSWEVSEIRMAYAELIGKGISKVNPTKEGHLTGYAGEVVLARGVRIFFQNPKVRERYGYTHITDSMDIMVAAEGVRGGVNFPDRHREWLEAAELVFKQHILKGESGESITDFFFREGVPVEHKAKLYSRIWVSETGERIKKRHDNSFRGNVSNEYMKQLQKTKTGAVVGWTWISVEYEKINEHSSEYMKAKKLIGKGLARVGRALNTPVLQGSSIDDTLDGLFKAVNIHVEGFMPLVISSRAYKKHLGRSIDLAAAHTDNKMSSRVVSENIKWIEELIKQNKRRVI